MATRTLANGAVLQQQPNGKFLFVSGASKEYLDSIRVAGGPGSRGPNTKPSSRPPSKAFLLRKLKEDKNMNKYAVKQDIARKNKKVLNPAIPRHARIIRKEGSLNRYDVDGLNHGNKRTQTLHMRKPNARDVIRVYPNAPKSAAQLTASRENIQKAQVVRRSAVGGAQQRAGMQHHAGMQHAQQRAGMQHAQQRAGMQQAQQRAGMPQRAGMQQRAGLGLGLFTQQAQKKQQDQHKHKQQDQRKQQPQQGGFWW